MPKAENKTQPTPADAAAFLAGVEPEQRRSDAQTLAALMASVSGKPATMWGPSIVGFGVHHYRYESGREGTTFRIGFSPRKAQLVLYFCDYMPEYAPELARLGPHTAGKGCLNIKRLDQVDAGVLEAMLTRAWVRQ